MHGIRPQPGIDDVRPHQFWFYRDSHAVIGEVAQRIFSRQQAADAPSGIFERRFHGMPAIEQHRTVGLMARRTEPRSRRGGSSFGALASRAWVWLPGFLCHRRLISCVRRVCKLLTASRKRSIDFAEAPPHKTSNSRLAQGGADCLSINTVPRLRGRVSRAAKGADCKSAGYAFVGSSPTSPTTLKIRDKTQIRPVTPALFVSRGLPDFPKQFQRLQSVPV